MAALFGKLQAYDPRSYKLQQPSLLYGDKKPKFKASPLSSIAVKVLFSDWLLIEESKWATDTLSQYSQQNTKDEITFRVKNTKILYCKQSSIVKVSGLNNLIFIH